MSNREIRVQPGRVTPSPWPRGDITLKRLLDIGYTRPRIADELSRELRMRVTDDQVTNRGKRKGWIIVEPEAPKIPKGLVPITPQRLGAIIAARTPVRHAKTCQNPAWHDKDDSNYGMFCDEPCDAGSSYCAHHRAINTAEAYSDRIADAAKARNVEDQLDRMSRSSVLLTRVVRQGELAPRAR